MPFFTLALCIMGGKQIYFAVTITVKLIHKLIGSAAMTAGHHIIELA